MTVINEYTFDELDSFYKAMKSGSRYVMLRGGTGTGKTMYAKELAWRLTNGIDGSEMGDLSGKDNYKKIEKNSPYISLVNQQVTKTYAYPIWLIGEAAKNTGSDMSCTITIDIGGKTIDLLSVSIGTTTLYGYVVPVCIPIPANTTFTLTASGGFLSILNVYALPCL